MSTSVSGLLAGSQQTRDMVGHFDLASRLLSSEDDARQTIIIARKGQKIVVDADDAKLLEKYTWSVEKTGYAYRSVCDTSLKAGKRKISMHREIMGLAHGIKLSVDHINGDPTDNRRVNLRVCTHAENMRNRAKTKNKVLPKGVSRVGNRYYANICVNYTKIRLGGHATPGAAYAAYCEAADRLHGEFANHGDKPGQTIHAQMKADEAECARLSGFVPAARKRPLPYRPVRSIECLQFVPGETVKSFDRRLIEATLRHFYGRRDDTAKTLRISQKTLYNRIKALGIDADRCLI